MYFFFNLVIIFKGMRGKKYKKGNKVGVFFEMQFISFNAWKYSF